MLTAMPKVTYFKNKEDNKVVCTCCGKKIKKGYVAMGAYIGEDCESTIRIIFNRELNRTSGINKMLSVQSMHFDWIENR
jgi:hypothetical protein